MSEASQQPDKGRFQEYEPGAERKKEDNSADSDDIPAGHGDSDGASAADNDQETKAGRTSRTDDNGGDDDHDVRTGESTEQAIARAGEAGEEDASDRHGEDSDQSGTGRLQQMMDIPLEVSVELGRTTMQLQRAVSMEAGNIIELNRMPGEPLDLYVNDRPVARGEVVAINDVLALRITELLDDDNAQSAAG